MVLGKGGWFVNFIVYGKMCLKHVEKNKNMKTESPKRQLVNKIKSVNNILVTVSRSPSVDELASTIGLTMALNKLGKRSVAVFSGKIPQAIHFLQPEKTFESNADSLRDFIISLSKDKADRLKVRPDGDFVKVYITPYRTKITKDDLKFEDGDFNIELIIAVGVSTRDELDASIARHGKIFHNAVTATLNLGQLHDGLGMISWQDTESSCYAEMCYQLIDSLSTDDNRQLIDEPVATALLTGVVSATDQFRNKATTPEIMTLSANLMAKGANQQLITSELEANEDDEFNEAPNRESDFDRHDNHYGDSEFDRDRTNEASRDNGDNGSTNSDQEVDLHDDKNDELIERRLQEDREDLGRRRGNDALQAAQAKLLESEGSIYGKEKDDNHQPNKQSVAPEAPRVSAQSEPVAKPNEPSMAQAPVQTASVTPGSQSVKADDSSTQPNAAASEPYAISLTQPVPPARPAATPNLPTNTASTSTGVMQSQPQAQTNVGAIGAAPAQPSSQIYQVGGNTSSQLPDTLPSNSFVLPSEGQGAATSWSGSYLIDDNSPTNLENKVNSSTLLTPSLSDTPFNQPNQVSPIHEPTATVFPQSNTMTTPTMMAPTNPSLTQTQTPASAAMSQATTSSLPDMSLPLPPTPPAPAMPTSPTMMPPASTTSGVATSSPVSGFAAAPVPATSMPTAPVQGTPATTSGQPHDPGQFVIPS